MDEYVIHTSYTKKEALLMFKIARQYMPWYKSKNLQNWILAMELFGVGSGYSMDICRAVNLNPWEDARGYDHSLPEEEAKAKMKKEDKKC